MDIRTATNTLKAAHTATRAGEHFQAAQLFLTAQRYAAQCRSARRDDVFFHGHIGAVMQAAAVLRTSSDVRERSEAGRIQAESYNRFHKGL